MAMKRQSVNVVCELLNNELNYFKNIKTKRKKREWVKKRDSLSATNSICQELSLEDQRGYINIFLK